MLPIIVNNNNFAKGAPGEPTLLSFDDARTLFHEFGHGLHGLLSNVTYERLSGTSVLRDFVELPSQLFEHWLDEPDVLKRHARHVETGEPIPDELIAELHPARHFNQGYETVRYAASALVDMAAMRGPRALDRRRRLRARTMRLGLPPGVGVNHRLTHFGTCSRARRMRRATTCTWPRCSTPTASRPSSRPAIPSIRRSRERLALHLLVGEFDRAGRRLPLLSGSCADAAADAGGGLLGRAD